MSEAVFRPNSPIVIDETVVIGKTFLSFIEAIVPSEAAASISDSCVDILRHSKERGFASTGLVVGRVQSGKTLSYEGVIALARDNGFALVIVITGTSNPLLAQGERRLRADLSAADEGGWTFLSPGDSQQAPKHLEQEIRSIRENWLDPSTPAAYKRTAVVTLLKHHGRIDKLADLFAKIGFDDLPVLVIDDEADQASLNTLANKDKQSSTYSNLGSLRDSLPSHYYLQYTATPQAPLLIEIDDFLAPDFVCVLEPGDEYVGGEDYFGSANDIVNSIPTTDLESGASAVGPPPASLRQAMLEFLVGAAHVAAIAKPATRSMLVHPSRKQDAHQDFYRWVKKLSDVWHDDYRHAHEQFPHDLYSNFEAAWKSIFSTFPGLSSLESCWDNLGLVFRNLEIVEVNTRVGQTPVVKWSNVKFYILVGGQAIDRGFTVEGLTVTYMPRPGGSFTADSIQQRARFFGYKRKYFGCCRVYLEPEVLVSYQKYLEHEREMLDTLKSIEAGEESLKQWRRKFLLDPMMKPTRSSVITIPTLQTNYEKRWLADVRPIRSDAISLAEAWKSVEEIVGNREWSEAGFNNQRTNISVREALELLVETSPPSLARQPEFRALELNLARLTDEKSTEEAVTLYRMRGQERPGIRNVGQDKRLVLFQGRNASGYAGDRQTYDPDALISVQAHRLNLQDKATGNDLGEFLVLAWRLSETSSIKTWLLETED